MPANKMRYTLLVLFLIVSFNGLSQQKLSNEQERWLYRIVEKTPILKNNWQYYFEFDTQPFYRTSQMNSWLDYDAIKTYQSYKPESLIIHYDSIKLSSNGLISEASIKLTLWELNEELKKYIYHQSNCNDSLIVTLQTPLFKELPNRLSSKKRKQLLQIITHPSLPIFKKIEQLNAMNIDVESQKQLLNKWSKTISEYSIQRSQFFFGLLSGGEELKGTTFLAAGEGSGTAGLLYEWEPNPNDSTKRWYGKGIGLFTYKVRTHKKALHLQSHLTQNIKLLGDSSLVLHASLWGLDSSFKPMLIITDDTVTYHLFADYASKGLTPDRMTNNGISHVERIEQHKQLNITEPLREISSSESLNKAYKSKSIIKDEIAALESEIDTLKKYEPDNEEAINYRKRLIDVKLTNLSKKEQRVNELEQSFAAKYKEISKAEEKLHSMTELLGPNPQTWTREGRSYVFNNGVRFDTNTQDLIFPAGGSYRELEIRLLSAGYTLEGKKKDEVQAYVSITNAREPKQTESIQKVSIDTTFTVYFHPDEYQSYAQMQLPEKTVELLKAAKHYQFILGIANVPDSLKSNLTTYVNREREYLQPPTLAALNRFANIHYSLQNDTLTISCNAFADPVATRLSKAPEPLIDALKIKGNMTFNNRYLVALRAIYNLKMTLETLGIELKDEYLQNQLDIPTEELNLIIKSMATN